MTASPSPGPSRTSRIAGDDAARRPAGRSADDRGDGAVRPRRDRRSRRPSAPTRRSTTCSSTCGRRGGVRGAVRRGRRRACPRSPASSGRRGHPRRRRQRHHALPPPPGRRRPVRSPACCTSTAAAWCMLEAAGATYERWRDELAAAGLVVVGVEFRNGGGKHGPYPFPAGLERLRAGAAVGGRQQRRARHHQADRVGRVRRREPDPGHGRCRPSATASSTRSTASTPSARTSPTSGRRPPELPSLYENDGYIIECAMIGALAKVYDPTGEHATDPLAWPFHAARRRPRRPAAARHLGQPARPAARRGPRLLPQAARRRGDRRQPDGERHVPRRRLIFAAAMPDVYQATIRDIKGFADSL